MAALATEDWAARTFTPGVSATRVFEISSVASEDEAMSTLIAQMSVDYNTSYPILIGDPIAVQDGGIAWSRKGRNYVATVGYAKGAAIGDFDPSQAEWDAEVTWFYEESVRLVDGAGKAIVNSTRDPQNTNLRKKRRCATIVLTRPEVGTDVLAKNQAYGGKVNTQAVVLPKFGTAAPGEIMLESIDIVGSFKPDAATVPVRYTFTAKPRINAYPPAGGAKVMIHGFRNQLPDVGTRGIYSSAGGVLLTGNICWRATDNHRIGQPVEQPVNLDGRGRPCDSVSFGIATIASGALTIGTPAGQPSAPTHYLTSPDTAQPGDPALRTVTLLWDASDGEADLNDLDIDASN